MVLVKRGREGWGRRDRGRGREEEREGGARFEVVLETFFKVGYRIGRFGLTCFSLKMVL